MMMRTAIIDLGTNSVRFDIHEFRRNSQVVLLYREKIMVRLGQDVFTTGKINPEAAQRTLNAFLKFRRISQLLHANRVIAFGTSALRDAQNGRYFIQKIYQKTGIPLRVMSGKEEAKMIALGILKNEKALSERFALVDIGGGSTEISIIKKRKLEFSQSFQLGTARLQQIFLKKSPPSPRDLKKLRVFIDQTFLKESPKRRDEKLSVILGSSGTIRAISKIFRKVYQTSIIDIENLINLIDRMSLMTSSELLKIPGMKPERVDMILAGALLLHGCMSHLNVKKVKTTEFSLRDGILEMEKKRILSSKKPQLDSRVHSPRFT